MTKPPLPGPGEPPLPPWPGAQVGAGDRTLFVRRAGTPGGPTAIFVHGLGGSSNNWTDLMALLADRVDGHAPDLPGFGRSGPPRDRRYPLDVHVRAVRDYVEQLGRGPVHLFGNSLGGAVATRFAAEHPELVTTLTLVAPALPQYVVRRTADPRVALMLLPGVAGLVRTRRQHLAPEALAKQFLALCVADVSAVPPERVDLLATELTRRAALPWTNDALVASLRGLVASYFDPGPRNLWRQMRRVQAPTLAIFGRVDRLVPVAVAARMRRALPGADVVVLDHVAHVPQIEDPAHVASLVRAHLDAHSDPHSDRHSDTRSDAAEPAPARRG